MALEKFGPFELKRLIATGGMAEVWLASRADRPGEVVIKRVLPQLEGDSTFDTMFVDEGQLAMRLKHPHIAQTYDLGQIDGHHYLVMEYAPGHTLADALRAARKRGTGLPMACVLSVLGQLLDALSYTHGLTDDAKEPLRIVHRDVTPTNVMILPGGEVKLLDFGIARAATQMHRTSTGVTRGKLGYMSPEQASAGPIDHRSDLFSVGAMLYDIAVGEPPYDHKEPRGTLLPRIFHGQFVPPSQRVAGFDPALEKIIMRAMARSPNDRYQSAREFALALEQYGSSLMLVVSSQAVAQVVKSLFPQAPPEPVPQVTQPGHTALTEPGTTPGLTRATNPGVDDRAPTVRTNLTGKAWAAPSAEAVQSMTLTEEASVSDSSGPKSSVQTALLPRALEPRETAARREWSTTDTLSAPGKPRRFGWLLVVVPLLVALALALATRWLIIKG